MTKAATILQERLEWLGLGVGHVLLAPLGPQSRSGLAGWAGRTIGPRLGAAGRIDRALIEHMPDATEPERRRIVRGVFDNFARTLVEYSTLKSLFDAAPSFEVVGAEHLVAAREAAGGRMVLASAHYGNWEAVRAAALLHDVRLGLIYRAFNNPHFERLAKKNLASVGLPSFHKGRDGARALLRHVAKEGGAMILVDQRLGGAPLVDFLGAPAETSLAAAQLALRAKAPLVTAYARRLDDGFRVVFEPAIAPAAPEVMMAEANQRIGAWVMEEPAQWFWLHRRWRVRNLRGRARKRSAGTPAALSDENENA